MFWIAFHFQYHFGWCSDQMSLCHPLFSSNKCSEWQEDTLLFQTNRKRLSLLLSLSNNWLLRNIVWNPQREKKRFSAVHYSLPTYFCRLLLLLPVLYFKSLLFQLQGKGKNRNFALKKFLESLHKLVGNCRLHKDVRIFHYIFYLPLVYKANEFSI